MLMPVETKPESAADHSTNELDVHVVAAVRRPFDIMMPDRDPQPPRSYVLEVEIRLRDDVCRDCTVKREAIVARARVEGGNRDPTRVEAIEIGVRPRSDPQHAFGTGIEALKAAPKGCQ